MAGFEGWWVNGNTGKGYHVSEHWMEVKSDPAKFGLTDDQVEDILRQAGGKFMPGDTSPDGARGLLLKAAMKNGWVRVRGYRGKYAIQVYGHLASHLPKVMKFLKTAGVGPYSEILLSDLSSDYNQTFVDGMSDVHQAMKQGKIPDHDPQPAVKDIKGMRTSLSSAVNNRQLRHQMRLNLGQRTHVPDPDPADDRIEESKALQKGLTKLIG